MKTAIYIEDGVAQVVLTPETDWERKALSDLKEGVKLGVKTGSFYDCGGGWVRYRASGEFSSDDSVMLSVKKQSEDVKGCE